MAEAVQTSWTSYECRDGFVMPVWSVRPVSQQSLPGILLIYEAFGMNKEMQRVASEIAANGYVVIIPDLLKRGSYFTCMRRLMADMKAEKGRSIDDLLDARTYLAARPDVLSERLAVVGFCLGGGFALVLAKSGLFQVSAPFYGQAPDSMDGRCPVVASYGACDRITIHAALKLEKELPKSEASYDLKIYPNAGHSFMTEAPNKFISVLGAMSPANAKFAPEAAKDATQRLLTFLAVHL